MNELLAPAKNLECGLAAINCGADAVYIGAERFGARADAGNMLDDIAALVEHAHKYWARVYATLNILLRDAELPDAIALAWQLDAIGVDGLIIQDTGLLECDLPPIPLIASTQMHNNTPEKVAFLEQIGFSRVILARELDLDAIREIRAAAPRIELECFVHGSLCVCYSGQCYLSYALGGRSGNRGQCAQPCRKAYSLIDGQDRVLEQNRHLLSIRDLNLSDHLGDLIDAGVTSFKIEGRLKDMPYVANTVAYYRARLDEALDERGVLKSSSGTATYAFDPNLEKTFNRGFTTHFLQGRTETIGCPDSPKVMGEEVGLVAGINRNNVTIETSLALHAGDGICFFDTHRQLRGTFINKVDGNTIVVEKPAGIQPGTLIHRSHDREFIATLKKARMDRRIGVELTLSETTGGLLLQAVDEDNVAVEQTFERAYEPAQNPEDALAIIRRQLTKTGATEFKCTGVTLELPRPHFLPVAALNAMRRDVLAQLAKARSDQRPTTTANIIKNDVPYPQESLTYLGNVLNRQAELFYRRHGVTKIERAAESNIDMLGHKVMTCRYCIKHQLGFCPRFGGTHPRIESLALLDEEGNRLELRFNCQACEMDIYLTARKGRE